MRPNGEIDKSLLSLASAFNPENKGIFHIVEYNDLVEKPDEIMLGIYDFLELSPHNHNFNNIEKIEFDKDANLGLPQDLHKVGKLLSESSTSVNILSDYVKHKYSNLEFWRDDSLMRVKGRDF
jgi:hypothetical protein